jgi:predicted nucleic acid-binding Zn ribbon protein
MKCPECKKTVLFLIGGRCKTCGPVEEPMIEPAKDLPKKEKASFVIPTDNKRLARRLRLGLITGTTKIKQCEECKVAFPTRISRQRFCSRTCQVVNRERRIRKAKNEQN